MTSFLPTMLVDSLPITDPTWIFFVVLLMILVAPMVLSSLRIPHIVGMILAGVVVGKYGFNILERDSSFELFGRVGLYYIMFLAGLEMNMEDFKQNRVKGLVFGILTFFIPMGLGIWSSMQFLHYEFLTATLLASMYASHTLLTFPMLSRHGLTRQRCVNIVVGGTAVTVVFALMVLAGIGGMFKNDESSRWFLLLMLLQVSVLSVLTVFVVPRICRWFFRKYKDGVMQFVFVLAVVFLCSGLMQLVGMEGILGAFLAGLVVNRFVPHVSPLMTRIEFVGNALFIPYFLIGVGMIINVRTFFNGGEALKVAVVMTVVATFSKWLAAFVMQKAYGMRRSERLLMFGLSNAQAAATLAAVLIGHGIVMDNGQRLLNDDVLNGTVMMILFTCIISSVATEKACGILEVEGSADGADPEQDDERILIPVGGAETLENLVSTALLMRNPHLKRPLYCVNVVNDDTNSIRNREIGLKLLDRAEKYAMAADVTVDTQVRLTANVSNSVIHAVMEKNASEMIVGLHHKRHIADSFLGSFTSNLVENCYRQIMVVKCLEPFSTLRRIHVAVPPKAECEDGFHRWLERLSRMAEQIGCRIEYHANRTTLFHLQHYVARRHPSCRAEYTVMDGWDSLLMLSNIVSYDHLFVVVTARKGTPSYSPLFEELPQQITHYFSNSSLLLIYPEQTQDNVGGYSFLHPLREVQKDWVGVASDWVTQRFKNKMNEIEKMD